MPDKKKRVSASQYVYQYKDHLGNVRLSYSDSDNNGTISQSEIIEENNYYPFGLKHKGYNSNVNPNGNSVAQKFKYNGKELQEDLNLNWYDYGARNYDASLGRYFNIDNFAEAYLDLNPYQYTANNPIKFIDVNGDYIYIWENGTSYRYSNGQLQKQNEDNEWEEFNAEEGSYAAQILSSLNDITGGDPNSFGSVFLGLFENEDINVNVRNNPIRSGKNKDRNITQGTDIYTSFNQSDKVRTTGGNQTSPFHITFAHELAHGFANNTIKEVALEGVWVSNVKTDAGNKDIRNSEVYASTIENMLRSEQGLELRTHYIGGTADNSSRLIKKSKSGGKALSIYVPTEQAAKIWNMLSRNRKVKAIIAPKPVGVKLN